MLPKHWRLKLWNSFAWAYGPEGLLSFVVALERAGLIGSAKSRFKTFLSLSYEEQFPVSDFTTLSIEVIEFVWFQHHYFWTDNSIIRRENCERFSFYYDLSALEQHSRFRALCNFFSGMEVPPPLFSPSKSQCTRTTMFICDASLPFCLVFRS